MNRLLKKCLWLAGVAALLSLTSCSTSADTDQGGAQSAGVPESRYQDLVRSQDGESMTLNGGSGQWCSSSGGTSSAFLVVTVSDDQVVKMEIGDGECSPKTVPYETLARSARVVWESFEWTKGAELMGDLAPDEAFDLVNN